jgi:hypothetical protein
MNLPRSDFRREIADMVRLGGPTVDAYLNYAKRYAELAFDHARASASATWPNEHVWGCRLLAILKLQEETPERVEQKVKAIQAKATVSQVIPCRHTMSLYIFGPDNQ